MTTQLPATGDNSPKLPQTFDERAGLPQTGTNAGLPVASGAPSAKTQQPPHALAGLHEAPHVRPAVAPPASPKMPLNTKGAIVGAIVGAVVGWATDRVMDQKINPHILPAEPTHVATSSATDEALRRQFKNYTPPAAKNKEDTLAKFKTGPDTPGTTMSVIFCALAGAAMGFASGKFKMAKIAERDKLVKAGVEAQRAAENAKFTFYRNQYGNDDAARAAMAADYPDTWGAVLKAQQAATAKTKPPTP